MAKSSAAIIGYETASPSSYSDEKELCHTTNGGGHGSLSKAKEGPGRRELMIFWRCCRCGEWPMTKGTDKACLNVDCQRWMCANCPTRKEIIYLDDE